MRAENVYFLMNFLSVNPRLKQLQLIQNDLLPLYCLAFLSENKGTNSNCCLEHHYDLIQLIWKQAALWHSCKQCTTLRLLQINRKSKPGGNFIIGHKSLFSPSLSITDSHLQLSRKLERFSFLSPDVIAIADLLFEAEPEEAVVYGGQMATFQCRLSNENDRDSYQITWLKNEQPLILDHRVRTTKTGLLEISDVRASDVGDYRCRITTLQGSKLSASAKLKLNPGEPQWFL